MSVAGAKNTVFLRAFDEGGRFTIPDLALEAPPDARAAEPGARVREGGDREPALAVLPDGRVVVAWNSNGSVVAQEFDARGKPLARARVLGGRNDPPAGAPRLVALEHAALCAWRPRERGPATAQLVAEDARPVALGDGVLDALAPDARGGAWAALHDPAKPKELGLVRFDGRGALVRDESARLALDATPVNVALACGPSSVVAAIGFAAEAAPANARRGAAPVGARARLFVGADAAHLAPAADDPFADGAVRPADLSAARAGNRFVVAWTLDLTLEMGFVLETMRSALTTATPTICNSDQGSHFTSPQYTQMLLAAQVQISMDGKGRALDNIFTERLWRTVKYEEVYLKDYASPREARTGIGSYLDFYNHRRLHQALDYHTPASIYFNKGDQSTDKNVILLS